MPRTLRDMSLPGMIRRAHDFNRQKELERRQDEKYSRESELDTLKHRDRVDELRDEQGARDVRRLSTVQGQPAQPGVEPAPVAGPGMDAGQTSQQPEQAPSGAEEEGAEAPGGQAAAPAELPKQIWLRTAEAEADYWRKRGRPERASKALIEAYKNQFAEAEARHNFEIQPQQQKIRDLNLTTEEIQADQKAVGVMRTAVQNQLVGAGVLWGLVKMGATREALQQFNSSRMLQEGVSAESIQVMKARGPDGQLVDVMVLLDKANEVLKDKNGKELIYPVPMLERMHRLATTTQMTVKKGESVYNVERGADGRTTATRIIGDDDPTEGRNTDTAWSQAINRHTDDAKAYVESALGLVKDPLGNILKPENLPLFERVMPRVTAALNEA
ncbi:MAG TPA: hypothetical protein VFB99_22610, partial [Vicinamibacterales bacterium]|nr:hypothetical protein [Vicinamibacterales bacterium]